MVKPNGVPATCVPIDPNVKWSSAPGVTNNSDVSLMDPFVVLVPVTVYVPTVAEPHASATHVPEGEISKVVSPVTSSRLLP